MSLTGRTPAECPVCGVPVHPKDRYCAACGAEVAVDGPTSLLDDLMAGGPAAPPRPTESTGPTRPTEPVDDPYHPDVPAAVRDDEPRGGGVLLPLLALVGVLLVAVLGWRIVFGPGGDETDVASDPAPGTSQSVPATPGSPEAPSPTEEPTPSPSPTPSDEGPERVALASTAEPCGTVGGATVYRGNDVTTCEFSRAVAEALGDAATPTRLSARSPVTRRDYAMDCEDTAPVTCRGGNDALVYVARG